MERRLCLSGVLSFNILSCSVELLSYTSSFSGSDGISFSRKTMHFQIAVLGFCLINIFYELNDVTTYICLKICYPGILILMKVLGIEIGFLLNF